MKIAAIKSAANRPDAFMSRHEDTGGEQTPGRALVKLDTPAFARPQPPAANPRPAAFLAHLIAVKDQLPQTRERRRAEPSEAVSTYRAALAATPAIPGRNFSRAT